MFIQFTICAIIILLCWITKDENKKEKIILPLSFMAITLFFAIRYDYGLDYWSYLNYYESGRTIEEVGGVSRGTGEKWFYYFMNLFPKFSYFIIAHTIITFSVLYFVTRKYLSPKYYPLFFFLILTMSVLSFNWISALRSTMAAAVLWIGMDLFYIKKKRWLPFIGMVVIAGFFHTSALFILVLPLVDFLIEKTSPSILFGIMIVGLISTLFFTEQLYELILSSSKLMEETYSDHLSNESAAGYTIFGVIHNSLLLFPFYFIITRKDIFVGPQRRIYILAAMIIILRCFKLDFNGRLSAYLFIFAIFALAYVLPRLKRTEKLICMIPMLVWCFYGIYLFYMTMVINQHTVYSEGNYLFYHTIFEPTVIP